jgi:diadenosine tetraphosphate (Ap4A) HIT family hydrolase
LTASCVLCDGDGGELVWRNDLYRVVLAPEPDYPGFVRVIVNRHVKEMTDLDAEERDRLMRAVFVAEAALREVMGPDKVNLASMGNVVPHLHWHVIPRFRDDPRFPDPVWGPPLRPGRAVRPDWREAVRSALAARL